MNIKRRNFFTKAGLIAACALFARKVFGHNQGPMGAGSELVRYNSSIKSTFAGVQSGVMSTARYSTCFGYFAGRQSSGYYHSCFGFKAGETAASYGGSFFGYMAGAYTTTGRQNSFFGRSAGQYTSTGKENAFFGYKAGFRNSTGSYNTFVGRHAGTGFGGSRNTMVGNITGELINGADDNTCVGSGAGSHISTGDGNTFIGATAGFSCETGADNIIIGRASHTGLTNSNCIVLGIGAVGTVSNDLVIGSAGTPINTQAGAGALNQYLIVNLNGTRVAIPIFNLS